MGFAKHYRWSDNDRRAGPFIYARDTRGYRPIAIVLSSGRGEEPEFEGGCTLRMSAFGRTLITALPQIVQPWKRWVDCSKYEWARSNPSGYWERHARDFGFSYSDGFLQIFLGPQTHDSTTTRSWSKFLPWTQWRHVRHSHYDLVGNLYHTEPARLRWGTPEHEANQAIVEVCPARTFAFRDFDGEDIAAICKMEEREWRFGTGWFRWLSAFRKPKIIRSLGITFSKETGPRKGSWKGGTIGHSIDMLPGELHEAAFRRYCEAHQMTFEREI